MSDNANVQPLRGPSVPDFLNQTQAEVAPPGVSQSQLEQLLNEAIARTTQEIQRQIARPSLFEPNGFEEIQRFAEMVAPTDFCPPQWKGKPAAVANIFMAIAAGKAVGLPAMVAMQYISVINGRPSIWGRAVAGVCIASGQVLDHREWWTGTPGEDSYTAHCEVRRKGMQSPTEGEFSYREVRHAALANVHRTYPRDMCMWKARHRAWFTAFPDKLMGLAMAELEEEEAKRNQFTLPRPEMSWQTPPASTTDWDNSWIAGALDRLSAEPNAWQWLEVLQDLTETAPTARDLAELEKLPGVAATTLAAPQEAQQTIAQLFRTAETRLAKPTEPTPPKRSHKRKASEGATEATGATGTETSPPASQPTHAQAQPPADPEFEYCLLDETGEPVDGVILMDPVAWARAYAEVADPRTMGYLGLREQNADALQDARKHPEAAKILDAIDAEADIGSAHQAEAREPVVIEPTLVRGKPDWQQYIKDLSAALAAETAQSLPAFVDAQRDRASTFPASTRLQASKVVAERALALGLSAPAGFTAPAPDTASDTAAPPADSPVSGGTVDKDRVQMQGIIAGLADLRTEYEVNHYSNQASVKTPKQRWEREGRPELAQELVAAFTARIAEIKQAGQAGA